MIASRCANYAILLGSHAQAEDRIGRTAQLETAGLSQTRTFADDRQFQAEDRIGRTAQLETACHLQMFEFETDRRTANRR